MEMWSLDFPGMSQINKRPRGKPQFGDLIEKLKKKRMKKSVKFGFESVAPRKKAVYRKICNAKAVAIFDQLERFYRFSSLENSSKSINFKTVSWEKD